MLTTLAALGKNLFFVGLSLLGVGFIIAFHELGHFLFCKAFNVKTPSFSIGFGPRLITKKIGETEFALSAIPFGGYVEIAGSAEVGQGDQKDAHSTDERSFANKPYWQKFLIIMGGILFNLIFSYFIFSLLFALGMPSSRLTYPTGATNVVAYVRPNSPAAEAGVEKGDTIVQFDGQQYETNSGKNLVHAWCPHVSQTKELIVERAGKKISLPITFGTRTFLGTTIAEHGILLKTKALAPKPFLQSIKDGISLTNDYIYNTYLSLKHLFTSRDTSMVGGPVKIIAESASSGKRGFKEFLLLLGIISISLALINLIPLPVLDGGQLLFHTIEAITGRAIPIKIKEGIHIVSWVLVMLLALYLSTRDIFQIVRPYISCLFK